MSKQSKGSVSLCAKKEALVHLFKVYALIEYSPSSPDDGSAPSSAQLLELTVLTALRESLDPSYGNNFLGSAVSEVIF